MARMRSEHDQAAHDARAQALWESFDANARFGIRFGMFPAKEMAAVEKEGYDGHTISVALMAVASKNGGMRA